MKSLLVWSRFAVTVAVSVVAIAEFVYMNAFTSWLNVLGFGMLTIIVVVIVVIIICITGGGGVDGGGSVEAVVAT